MSRLVLDISTSLDGFVAGPAPDLEHPLGHGGEQLHEWALATRAWREQHGMEGGEDGPDSDIARDHLAAVGATIMGRKMFSGGSGPWEDDPRARGWWGDEPPFRQPVFVLSHHARAPLELDGTTFTFVSSGIEDALEQARAAAGDRDVLVAGGAYAAQQYLRAGLLDEVRLHVAPVLLGGGTRLFERASGRLNRTSAVTAPSGVMHLTYEPLR
jgi:dihydrofolate reductase